MGDSFNLPLISQDLNYGSPLMGFRGANLKKDCQFPQPMYTAYTASSIKRIVNLLRSRIPASLYMNPSFIYSRLLNTIVMKYIYTRLGDTNWKKNVYVPSWFDYSRWMAKSFKAYINICIGHTSRNIIWAAYLTATWLLSQSIHHPMEI